ncbi:aldose 1-epimerase [Deefgea piscis]|uniref:aldose 1-epimerase n=1 Tax=Deefgea piscis TaxID=2739061 RepID=UPI001C80BEA4|nr:aldose 1-epimerase [Deefgea piscis]QZA81728.1 aldose 1-epimerase [Deefgea piscis]
MLTLISKQCGDLQLILVPQLGGAIAALKYKGVDILRSMPLGIASQANQCGSFPLIPYSNRIENGQFTFADQHYTLAKNFGDHPHSIHGNGWQSVWHVAETSTQQIVLQLNHDAPGDQTAHWPWPYRAKQVFSLTENSLHIQLSYLNDAAHAVPVGLGFHPYFANADQAQLQFCAQSVLINDSNMLPAARTAIPPQWDFRQARPVEPNSIDNCFLGWDGSAQINWPAQKLHVEITSPDAGNAIVFVPSREKNFLAFEPVSHSNNAINQDHGAAMYDLASGETHSISMTIRIIGDE